MSELHDERESIPLYQVDAFTDTPFRGNPAAVCLYEEWLPDETLQQIAAENNLSETAFLVPLGEEWELRWFTPTTEVDLCGHATLASAWVLFHEVQPERDDVLFHTKSGELLVERDGDELILDFPSLPAEPCDAPEGSPPRWAPRQRRCGPSGIGTWRCWRTRKPCGASRPTWPPWAASIAASSRRRPATRSTSSRAASRRPSACPKTR